MSLRILVADADGTLSGLMSRSLGRAGHQTVVSDAAGVKAALGRGAGPMSFWWIRICLVVGWARYWKRDQATVFLAFLDRKMTNARSSRSTGAGRHRIFEEAIFNTSDLEKKLSELTPKAAR